MNGTEHLEVRMDTFEKTLGEQSLSLSRADMRLMGVERAVGNIGDKVDDVLTKIGPIQNRKEFDAGKMIHMILAVGAMIGMASGAIIFVANSISAADTMESKMRVMFLEQRVSNGWFGTTTRSNADAKADRAP